MAREADLWWRESRNSWYTTIDGRQHKLCADKRKARRMLKALKKETDNRPQGSGLFVEDVFVKVLEWVGKHKSAATYNSCLQRCNSFIESAGDLSMGELKPEHVQRWVDRDIADGTKWTCIGVLKTVFNRAVKMGLIKENPIRHMERPSPGKREYFLTRKEHEKILSLVSDDAFRDLLTVAWECGPRPQELLRVEARHVDSDGLRWVFGKKESKGKKRMRAVYMTPIAAEITKRLMEKYPTGPLFRNSKGAPFTPQSVNCRFVRLQQKIAGEAELDPENVKKVAAGLKPTRTLKGAEVRKSERDLLREARRKIKAKLAAENGVKYCLYLWRHSFQTRMLLAGNDPITVAMIAGHSDVSTLAKTYAHVLNDPDHVRKALGKLQ